MANKYSITVKVMRNHNRYYVMRAIETSETEKRIEYRIVREVGTLTDAERYIDKYIDFKYD